MSQHRPLVFETKCVPPSDMHPESSVHEQRQLAAPWLASTRIAPGLTRDVLIELADCAEVRGQEENENNEIDSEATRNSYVLRKNMYLGLDSTVYLQGSFTFPYPLVVIWFWFCVCSVKVAQGKRTPSTFWARNWLTSTTTFPPST